MKKLALSSLGSGLLLLSLCLAAVSSTAQEFDFFYLVQQWPGSFCAAPQGCCLPDTGELAADFGIHGLWPNYAVCRNTGGGGRDDRHHKKKKKKCWPEHCDDGNQLSPLGVRDLLAQLERNWPTLSCKNGGRSVEFWSYEWLKHGTCSGLTQHEYFRAALDLKARYNLTAILADAGIVPSDTATYSLSSIRDAIAGATGFAVNVECNRDDSGEAQLFQVYQCVTRDGKELMDCTLPMASKCTDTVKMPTLGSNLGGVDGGRRQNDEL